MANYCWSTIAASATKSEWTEISKAFENNLIEWAIGTDGPDCNDWSQEITCENKWSPTPLNEGYMAKLSRSYPSVIFHYTAKYEGGERPDSVWFANGDEGNKRDAERSRRQAYKSEVERFKSTTAIASDGIEHRVEIMPDGRVAADGENRFGECNIFSWTNIKQISCGNWHTVGLRNDGTILACGSNSNGQCDVSNIPGRAISVSCGRYHTAILLDSGQVVIKGKLEQEAQAPDVQEEVPLSVADFPLEESLGLNKYISGWEKMNERIEHISAGDELTLKKVSKDGEVTFEVLNMRGEKIGNLYFDRAKGLAKLLKNVKATVATVTPLSQRRKGSKYAAMTIRLDYVGGDNKAEKKASTTLGDYEQTKVASWPAVTKIKSVFDAVIGVTSDGKMFVDGFCPCSEADLMMIMGLNE